MNLGLIIAATLVISAGCATVKGTAAIADSSRSGVIHDVVFEERMTPVGLQVRPGDEVRWVNRRSTVVRLEFLEGALDDVVCQSGFSSLLRRQQEAATIRPNETASLCFGKVGTIRYNARMESPVAGGQMIESGTLYVVR
ncbi:MAG: hypothetical protein EA370_06740 [Wenzhouxiangella sp.]|nr:MAG: hypothetical protein EA370_06740 [Wenzhouxiangella sp.]